METVSIKDWVTKCYACLGKKPEFVNVYDDIEQRNFFSFYNYEYYLDVQRQNKIYTETISLDKGLKESAEWYLANETEVNKNHISIILMQISAPNIDRITLGTWGDHYGYSVRPYE